MRKLSAFMLIGLGLISFSCTDDDDLPIGQEKTIQLNLIAEGLTSPVYLTQAPDDKERLFVLDQIGLVRIIKNGQLQETPFLDLRSKLVQLNPGFDERGLLGLAFHPDYDKNGRFFVYYSAPLRPEAPDDFNHTSHISEFRVSPGNPDQADLGSERLLLAVDQPQFNHNAGTLKFGPDKYLYISLGDGGGANDVGVGHVEDWYEENAGGNAQNIEANLLGKILRIDVNSGHPYGIPGDNPFVNRDGLDEIYAYGLRNPYRFSFDKLTGMLLAGDAGQALFEEVSVIRKGQNYGWNVKEARSCFNAADNMNPLPDCPDVDPWGNRLIDPVIEFGNSENVPGGLGNVVIGGYVYRGTENIFAIGGSYLFGVFAQGQGNPGGAIFAANPLSGNSRWSFRKLEIANFPNRELGEFLLAFGQDNAGELYVLTQQEPGLSGNTGKVYKIN